MKGQRVGETWWFGFSAIAIFVLTACGPNRTQWMAQAATQQANLATAPIGNSPDEVRKQAKFASSQLKGLAAPQLVKGTANLMQNVLHKPPDFTADLPENLAQVYTGLDDIAGSQNDEQFAAAVFSMCDAVREKAASHAGQVLTAIASAMANPPQNAKPSVEQAEQWKQAAIWFQEWGEYLIDVPSRCEHASAAMAEAEAEERQAEIQHQENVNAAVTAAAAAFGTALLAAGTVAAAEASRPIVVQSPPVVNNYYMVQPALHPWGIGGP